MQSVKGLQINMGAIGVWVSNRFRPKLLAPLAIRIHIISSKSPQMNFIEGDLVKIFAVHLSYYFHIDYIA